MKKNLHTYLCKITKKNVYRQSKLPCMILVASIENIQTTANN